MTDYTTFLFLGQQKRSTLIALQNLEFQARKIKPPRSKLREILPKEIKKCSLFDCETKIHEVYTL